jgi:multicomponent K+:H+ antiporter subunit A
MGFGLLAAGLTGTGAWFAGYPFLTSHAAHPILPLFGSVSLSSALAFDLGVLSMVFGATVLMLIALAHQSLRSHRAPRVAASSPAVEVGEG